MPIRTLEWGERSQSVPRNAQVVALSNATRATQRTSSWRHRRREWSRSCPPRRAAGACSLPERTRGSSAELTARCGGGLSQWRELVVMATVVGVPTGASGHQRPTSINRLTPQMASPALRRGPSAAIVTMVEAVLAAPSYGDDQSTSQLGSWGALLGAVRDLSNCRTRIGLVPCGNEMVCPNARSEMPLRAFCACVTRRFIISQ